MGGMTDMRADRMPLFGQFMENPDDEAKLRSMSDAAETLHAYRPEANAARERAMQQQMSLMNPYNNAVGQMYGPGAMADYQGSVQSPISQNMEQLGKPNPYMDRGAQEKKRGERGSKIGTALLPGVGTIIGGQIGSSYGRKKDEEG